MSAVVGRISCLMNKKGTIRYYAAYNPVVLTAPTIVDVPPDRFLEMVRWPKRNYLWKVVVFAPTPNHKHIILGVRMYRRILGPNLPGVMLPRDEALLMWRGYACLMWAKAQEAEHE